MRSDVIRPRVSSKCEVNRQSVTQSQSYFRTMNLSLSCFLIQLVAKQNCWGDTADGRPNLGLEIDFERFHK
ncbi:UNVERIFIED_CONTAM: hypothetical protein NCL1_38040 [Trichonephila clavipes]